MNENIEERAFSKFFELGTRSRWLTTSEAAYYLRVSTAQLYNLTSTGNLPYYKLGRSNRYKVDDLDSYLEKNNRGFDDY
jgi:excisionase family DNA binding protein